MATDVEKLVVQLSADIKQYQREMQRAQGVTNAQARAIENRYRQMDRRLGQIGSSAARSLIAPLTGIAAVLSAKEVGNYADAWTIAGNKIAAAGQIAGREGRSLEGINEIANRTRSGITETTDLYAKLLRSTAMVANSEEEVARATEIVNKSFKAGGAAVSEQVAGILQLSQALGSGLLQGDELRSLRENAPLLAEAIAKEFGVTIAGLKDLGAEGKLTTDRVFKAILNAQPQIEAAFKATNQTIADGMTRVNNAFTQYIGQSDASLSASERLISGLNALADNFDETADVVLKVAAVIAGALVGRSIGLMVTKLGLATGVVIKFVAALRAASTVAGVTTAIGGLSAAAGPLGLIIGGTVVGALALFASSSDTAGEGADRFARRLERMGDSATEAAEKAEQAGGRINEVLVNKLTSEVAAAETQVNAATQSVLALFDTLFANVDRDTISPEQLRQLEELRDKLRDGEVGADDAKQALHALANSNPNFQAVANAFRPLLDNLALVIAGAKEARKELAIASGAQLSPQQVAGYRQYGQSRQQGEEMLRLGKAYADEAARQNSLSKEQMAIEKEIATVKKDIAAKGGFLPENEIRRLAEQNVAADSARSKSGKSPSVKQTADSRFDSDIQAIRDRTAALVEEQRIVGLSFRDQEQRRMALDLEQSALADLREEARRKGQTDLDNIKLTDQQIARIREASAAYADQADALRLVEEAQHRAEEAANDFYDAFKTETIDAITGAKSLSEALSSVAKRLGDLLLNGAFDSLFKPSSGGGFFSFLKSAFGGGAGASNDPWGGLRGPGYASGTANTGGARGQPRGVVHGQEAVIPLPSGGKVPVNIQAPRIPSLASTGGSALPSITYAPVYNVAQGADPKAIAALEQAQAKDRAEFSARVVKTIRGANSSRQKFG